MREGQCGIMDHVGETLITGYWSKGCPRMAANIRSREVMATALLRVTEDSSEPWGYAPVAKKQLFQVVNIAAP